MPSRKQRRRREKNFRHEYEVVLVDGEGNEIEVDPDERRAAREAKERARTAGKPAKGKQGAATRRALREPPMPTWSRAIKRGGLMGAAILLAFTFLFKNGTLPGRLAIGIAYGIAFVPLTYFIDRTAYRSYEKRLARNSAEKG
jgi:hypothetical protein